METMIGKIPSELNEKLKRASEKQMTSKAAIMRQAIERYCEEILGE